MPRNHFTKKIIADSDALGDLSDQGQSQTAVTKSKLRTTQLH